MNLTTIELDTYSSRASDAVANGCMTMLASAKDVTLMVQEIKTSRLKIEQLSAANHEKGLT